MSSADEARLFADQVDLIYQQTPVAYAGLLVNVLVLTYALWDIVSHRYLLAWLGASIGVVGVRLVLSLQYKRSSHASNEVFRWSLYYLGGVLASGILWGIAGTVLFPQGNLVHQVFIAFLAGGLSAGSVAAYAAIPWLAAAFFLPALVPVTVQFFIQGNEISTLMGTMVLIFTLLIAAVSRNMSRITLTYLRLRMENSGLVAYLTQSKQQAEVLNADLRSEIEERTQAEKALRESEEKFRGLVENATDPIVLTVRERIVYANQAASDLVGYSEDELLTHPISAFMAGTPLGRELVAQRIRDRDAGLPLPIQYEAQIQHKDGSIFDVIVSSALVHLGEQAGTITLVKDITERKKAETELRRAKERAEEATRLKDQFVSLVAHDLKSPLTSIFGMIQILNDDGEHPLSSHQKEIVRVITRGGETLLRTIDDLLSISRLQTGKIKPTPRFIDAHAVTEAAIAILVHLASEKSVTFVNDVPQNTRLYADPELMGKVIQNLVSNAIKFCRRGDRITVYVPIDRPTTLAVKDTGVGIPESKLGDLFNPEVVTTTLGTAGERGTGLGLILSLDIMRAHGGDIAVESAEGEGSVFYVMFPEVRPSVLLVGSNALFRQLLQHQLEGINADFLHARDGDHALAMLEKDSVHLVIAETDLPGMNGFDLLRRIREGTQQFMLPVILIVDSGAPDIVEEAFRLGADDTITKPLVPYDFIARLRRFVR